MENRCWAVGLTTATCRPSVRLRACASTLSVCYLRPVLRLLVSTTVIFLSAPALAAQSPAARLVGQWQARGPDDEIHDIMVRRDSSAQFGDQLARWRVVGDSLWLTLGDGAWLVYAMKLERERLTLSGGDLEKPVTLRRVGPATARADTAAIPEAPPAGSRAW